MAIINIGILAHVDAGKTSLTERILFETGIISSTGSVDRGTTQTDTMELERSRGITIRSAVVSFKLNDLTVNLIDTPGHADFVAEVERSLRVLDAVVLVVSAVEGVQPQTRRLVRAVRAAGLPLIIFVNKIDRIGARNDPLLADIRRKLGLRIIALSEPVGLGDRNATATEYDLADPARRAAVVDLLSESSDRVIEEFERTGGNIATELLTEEIRMQTAACDLVPLYFGSAILGVGVATLLAGMERWLPPANRCEPCALDGTIFKIARRSTGEKIVYLRLFAGTLAVRQRIKLERRNQFGEFDLFDERITGIDRFTGGTATPVEIAGPGEIVCLHGLRESRIGDRLEQNDDEQRRRSEKSSFPTPALESVVTPSDPAQIARLRSALEQLAEQDPLISLRQRNDEGELSVRLYGDVQKEIVQETLLHEYGIAVTFGPSLTVCIERPTGIGETFELITDPDNPFQATIGFRVQPGASGSGTTYYRELGSLPLAFYRAIEETVHETLAQGLHGWEVVDIDVTLTHAGFSSPVSIAADFRRLTPLVLMAALQSAGTEVCEPIEELIMEIPEGTFGAVCSAVINARGTIRTISPDGETQKLTCDIPTAEIRTLEYQLPGLTRGEGGWESRFAGYQPITEEIPLRTRIGPDPLNRAQYLAEVARK